MNKKLKLTKMATKWWGADNGPAPICMFTERPICYEEKEKT